MSIHQIEYEILEGRFWHGWLYDHPDYFGTTDQTYVDRQSEKEPLCGKRTDVRQVNHWFSQQTSVNRIR